MPADPTMMPVMAADVGHRNPAHEFLELPITAWPQDQMPMIGHEAPGQQVHAVSLKSFGQTVQKRLVIPGLSEDPHPPVAAVQDVIDYIRDDLPKGPRHGAKQ